MIEILNGILKELQKDIWDYLGIIAPIFLSVVAIVISMWNSFWSRNIKKLEANLVWDEIVSKFFIMIRNIGKKTLVIKTISLVAYDKKNKYTYELGTQDNVWRQEKGYIEENKVAVIEPCCNSNYDVFAYRGHFFDVTEDNANLMVSVIVTDIDGKSWEFLTSFTIGEIDSMVDCSLISEYGK